MLNISLPTDDTVILIIILATALVFAAFSLVTLGSRWWVLRMLRFGRDEKAAITARLDGPAIDQPGDVLAEHDELVARQAEYRRMNARNERNARVIGLLNLISTIATVLFVLLAIATYFFGHSQTALKLDVVGIVFLALKAAFTGFFTAFGGWTFGRVKEAQQKAEQTPKK